MAIDVLCLTEEQRQNLDELLMACRFLVELKQHKMAESAINHGIEQVAAAIREIDKS
jgi:hypothetical protein